MEQELWSSSQIWLGISELLILFVFPPTARSWLLETTVFVLYFLSMQIYFRYIDIYCCQQRQQLSFGP